tara:strand:+ start:337 stop:525 length:189 start_codon:yes stop_codon:yes gene_type:complete
MNNWTEADEISYAEAAEETDWDFEDIKFLKSHNPQPPKKSGRHVTIIQNPLKQKNHIYILYK